MSEAQIVLANFLQSNLLRVRNMGRGIGQNIKSMTALVKTAVVAQESARMLQAASSDGQSQKIEGDGVGSDGGENQPKSQEQLRAEFASQEEVMMQVAEKALPLVYDTVWTLNTAEISNLTSRVARGVLNEKNMEGGKVERRNRAIAIYELGRIFRSHKDQEQNKSRPDATSLIADIETAVQNVMMQNS